MVDLFTEFTFKSYTDFNCAVTELIGHCYFGDEKQFNKWTEDEIHTQLSGYDIGKAFSYEKWLWYSEITHQRVSRL